MTMDTDTQTVAPERNSEGRLSPEDVYRLFGDGYREVEVLPNGHVREAPHNGHPGDETVTRTLKTQRTWY